MGMGRMYGKGKGMSSSALPYRRKAPTWVKMKPDDVVDHICKLAKKGLAPSQIGVTLRDSFGVPQVGSVTGSKILRILKSSGHPKALGQESQGQGFEVPPHPHGKQDSQVGPLVQAREVPPSDLQVCLCHGLRPGGLSGGAMLAAQRRS